MNRHDITAAIHKVGWTQERIQTELKVAHGTVSAVCAGRGRSKRVEKRISEVTGLPLAQLWPQWYAAETSIEQSPDLMDAIPARLIAERERLGFTPKAMAEVGMVTVEEQMRYECGGTFPSALYLGRAARSTHFDALYVITGRRESGRVGG